MAKGSVVHVGGEEVVKMIESMGYERFFKEVAKLNV